MGLVCFLAVLWGWNMECSRTAGSTVAYRTCGLFMGFSIVISPRQAKLSGNQMGGSM